MLCPFCKETIKNDAVKCRHCGSDLTAHQQNLKAERGNKPFYKKWWVWGLVILFLPGMCQSMFGPSTPSTSTATSSTDLPPPVSEKFKNMPPAEHLANAKTLLKNKGFTAAKMHLDAIPKDAKEFSEAAEQRKELESAQRRQESANKISSDERHIIEMERKVKDLRTKLKKYYASAEDVRELNTDVTVLTVAKTAYANSKEPGQKRIYAKMAALLPQAENVLRDAYCSSIEEIFVKNGMDIRVNAVGDGKKTLRLKYALMSQPLIYKFQNEMDISTQAKAVGFKKVIYTNGFESDLESSWTVKLN